MAVNQKIAHFLKIFLTLLWRRHSSLEEIACSCPKPRLAGTIPVSHRTWLQLPNKGGSGGHTPDGSSDVRILLQFPGRLQDTPVRNGTIMVRLSQFSLVLHAGLWRRTLEQLRTGPMTNQQAILDKSWKESPFACITMPARWHSAPIGHVNATIRLVTIVTFGSLFITALL
jgi:hypothetical protein